MKLGLWELLFMYMPVFVAIIAICFVILLIAKLIKTIARKNRNRDN